MFKAGRRLPAGRREFIMKHLIAKAVQGQDLDRGEMAEAMELILSGQARSSQMAALLTALRLKGETVEEIAAAAEAVRRFSPRLAVKGDFVVLDRDEINLDDETIAKTCFFEGDGTQTFNISTATALVAAGGGLKVAKCGARTESVFCGSADVVSALGVNLELTLTEVERCLEQIGLGFLYANVFHTSLAGVAQVREEIGVRSIFNLIGPLTNPAGAQAQVLGVYLPERIELMAQVLDRLGCRQAMVVYGQDTLDELSITGPSRLAYLKEGRIETMEIVPEDLGLTRAAAEEIRGGSALRNAEIIEQILEGAPGPRRDVVLMNAAAAFTVAGSAGDLREGIEAAKESIDSGRALQVLDDLRVFTARCGVYQHKDVS